MFLLRSERHRNMRLPKITLPCHKSKHRERQLFYGIVNDTTHPLTETDFMGGGGGEQTARLEEKMH